MKKHIICCGNIAFDIIETAKDKEGGISFQAQPGGSVFNTALQLSRLGLSVTMAAKVGRDFLGDELLGIASREKVCSKYIVQDENIKTGLAFARIDKKGDSSYVFYKTENKYTALEKKQLASPLFEDVSVFHTGSQFSYDDFTFENASLGMKKAKAKGVFVTYDPNWRERRIKNKKVARGRIKKLISCVDLLKLSETDATGITGTRTLSCALANLPKNTVITLGRKGSFFWDGKRKTFVPAFKVKVVDTIGAGDAFTSGLIYRYCQKGKETFWEEMKENLIFATAVSALVSSGRGALSGLKSDDQVRRFLNLSYRSLRLF